MSDVTPIKPGVVVRAHPTNSVPGVVDIARKLLAMAEAGEIHHVGVVYTNPEGGYGRMFDGKPSLILYALERLKRVMHEQADRDEMGKP